MNAMQRAMTAYGQASETLPPIRQIVLLYDGALRRIKEARRAIEAGRINDRVIAVDKAAAIVEGLQTALDHERGGEIAANLDKLYTYIGFRLHALNLTPDVGICDELTARLEELRAAWAELAGGGAAAPADATAEPGSERPGAATNPAGLTVTI